MRRWTSLLFSKLTKKKLKTDISVKTVSGKKKMFFIKHCEMRSFLPSPFKHRSCGLPPDREQCKHSLFLSSTWSSSSLCQDRSSKYPGWEIQGLLNSQRAFRPKWSSLRTPPTRGCSLCGFAIFAENLSRSLSQSVNYGLLMASLAASFKV